MHRHKTMRTHGKPYLARLLALLTGAMLGVMYCVSGLGGDDWAYMCVFGRADGFAAEGTQLLRDTILYPAIHWMRANGRCANYLAPFLLGFLPLWAVHLVLACGAMALSVLATRLAGAWHQRQRASAGALASLGVMFLLPWGDEMFTVDVALNYMFASAMILGFVWAATSSRHFNGAALCALGFMAGMMHEAGGAPVVIAATTYFLVHRARWKSLPRSKKAAWLCFGAGALAVTSSPGIWMRAIATAAGGRHWHMWESLLYSAPLAIVLIAVLGVIFISRCLKPWLKAAMSGPTWLFAVAAIAAVPFVAVADYVGRVGWFAQLYAMIALLRLLPAHKSNKDESITGNAACIAAALLITAHSLLTIPVLAREGRLTRDIDRQARTAAHDRPAIVYVDFPQVTAQPWYTWGKLRSIESHSKWHFDIMARYYRLQQLTPLPRAASAIGLDTLTTAAILPTGETISPHPPAPATGAPYRRRTLFSAPVPTDSCPTGVFEFDTPSGRRLYLSSPLRYHFYHWPSS